jgi:NAD(P)-dependent dehydrogenase (short-subunit alcohol dehydrogenase family)
MFDPLHLPDLRDHVVLVTGAGSGFGRASARALASAGATVVLLGRKTQPLESVYDDIVAAGGAHPSIIPFDLARADETGFERIAEGIASQLGRLDGIVHAAAQFRTLTPMAQQDLDTWNTLLRVDLMAPALLTRACSELLQAASTATVVFVSDTHGARPAAFWGAYGVAKAGLIALAESWDAEWSHRPTHRVHAVVPGPMKSPIRLKSHSAGDALGETHALPLPETLAPGLVALFSRAPDAPAPVVVHLQNQHAGHRG